MQIHDQIAVLLDTRPLPKDAEVRLSDLLSKLSEDERAAVEAGYHEALCVAGAAEILPP
ncbi:hypothetical protein [Antarctobacter sp.]|uniref:hypothetical protein n=1 Tax=Antarctobacter sp. TaxID=1872577 RepID=UPI002B26A677|nr:hypothetical protein [Antarctobacter sp.]